MNRLLVLLFTAFSLIATPVLAQEPDSAAEEATSTERQSSDESEMTPRQMRGEKANRNKTR